MTLPLDSLLLFKLIFTPLMIASSTLISRRWGVGVGGWIAGLPLISGPISVFLALQHGAEFAADAAVRTMTGSASAALFCVAYGFAVRRWRWPACVVISLGAFLVFTVFWRGVSLSPMPAFLAVCLVCALVIGLMPRPQRAVQVGPSSWWDIPLRMVFSTALLLAITSGSNALGPEWSGLLSPIPIYSTLMAAFAHAQQGSDGALRVLRGVTLGTFAFAIFFLLVSLFITVWPMWVTYAIASASAMGLNGLMFNAARR